MRCLKMIAALMLMGAGAALAAEPVYKTTVEATREGETIAVRLKVESEDGVLSAPQMVIKEGTRGTMGMFTEEAPATQKRADVEVKVGHSVVVQGEPVKRSGLQVDVMSVKGTERVVAVTTVYRDGLIVAVNVVEAQAKKGEGKK